MTDEFDDLDDYLDEFDEEILSQEPGATLPANNEPKEDKKNIENKPKTTTETGDVDELDEEAINDFNLNEFANNAGLDPQFSSQLENFMNMLDPQGNNSNNELKALFEQANSKDGETDEDEFQHTINETINRLKHSSQQVEDESTKKLDKDEELLTTLLNSLDIGGEGTGEGIEGFDELKDLLSGEGTKEGGEGGEEDVDKLADVVLKMINKLTSKDMMYDSVKSAVTNYREYFKNFKNNNKVNEENEDHKRYLEQFKHLENVLNKFDEATYNDGDAETKEFIDNEMENFNKLLPPPPGVIQDNLGDLGLDNVKWNDKEVPQDLDGCVQQ